MSTALVDIDGVLADFTGAVTKIVREFCGIDYPITEWMRISKIPTSAKNKEYIAWRIGTMGRELEVYEGAHAGIKALKEAGHDVHFVTSPWDSPTWDSDRRWWMKYYGFVRDPIKEITFTSEKWRVHGDILVDDKVKNVELWQKAWPLGVGLVWAQPWNSAHCGRRTYDWGDILSIANKHHSNWKQAA